ncbi:acetyltransferase (GNAT) family protein [Kribbella steppae]|uniref:Acetyltransferase (GNAT) family protein n=1 Tax=Kribbella steppae TaxID=2512223 RepID=A0A4R2HL43_9ACTN|nr:GNAT family N-acetyltransferase [Kribbella steppae]TCO30455.1 acetyltransferase (GNAT) family protein [Kribbella steppae]
MMLCLELTSPTQLVPGSPPPAPLALDAVRADAAPLIRTLYNRIWDPIGPSGRSTWTEAQWTAELTLPGIHTWLAVVTDEVAGFVELSAEPSGDVGIVVFGLVPEYQSKGFGGALLTLATQTAWHLNTPTTRVYLHTNPHEHPHTLPNYQSRGFRIVEPKPGQ